MTGNSNGQALIEAFFAALNLRDIDECEAVLARLQVLSEQQPAYHYWQRYFAGILANERDNDWAKAERIFNELLQAALPLPLRGRVTLAQGRTYEYQGRWQDAINTLEDSLSVFTELAQPVEQAKVKKQIAHIHYRGFIQGDFGPQNLELALNNCQSALEMLETIEDPTPDMVWLKGSIWNTLGVLHLNLEQWEQAIDCYLEDLAICQKLNDHHGMGVLYLNLGEVYQTLGQKHWSHALEYYQLALDILHQSDNRYLEVDVLFNLGLLYKEMNQPSLALDYLARAIQMIEMMRSGISSEAARSGFFATIVNIYAHTILLCVETGNWRLAFDYVEKARSRAFLDMLAANSPDLIPKMEAKTLSLADIQAALPANAALLAYFTTGLVDVQKHKTQADISARRHRFPAAKTLIFAVTKNTVQVASAKLSPNDLFPRQLGNPVEQYFLKPRIRHVLYDQLISPVESILQSKERVYLAPHGPLHYIPFQILIAQDNTPFLRESGPQLIYTPSATLLFQQRQVAAHQASKTCLALGYNSSGASLLRFAEDEARHIAHLTTGDVLAGTEAKKKTLFEHATDYRMFHFACHGYFEPDSPLSSALELAAGERLTVHDVIKALRLRCDLVVLSACDSGLSRIRLGDELEGFIRAFLYAGTPALISSLWRVDDRSTHILMENFYQSVQTGSGFAQALKQAQLYVKALTRADAIEILSRSITLRDDDEIFDGAATDTIFSDPYYWAPFILIGDHGSG